MSCFDGNIYLRKDYIVCDPDYGVSLTALIERVVLNMPNIGSSSGGTTFSCSLLSSCSIGLLSDVSSSTPSLNNVLKWTGTQYEPSTLNLSDLATVSNDSDSLNTTSDVGKVLTWSNQGKWVPNIIPSSSSSVKLNLGTSGNNEDITLNDSTTTPLIINGSGKISVTYETTTNTFTITDFTSPQFNGFSARVNTGTGTTRFFGEPLNHINFVYTSISTPSAVKTADGISLQMKDEGASTYSNLKTGITYASPTQNSLSYQLPEGDFENVTKTIFGSETFRLEGQTTQAGPFYSSTSSIKWITNYFFGYVTSKTHTFIAADLTGTVSSGVTRLSGGGSVDKKAFDFNFPSPEGKFIWMAVPTSLITGSTFFSVGFPLAETTRQTLASVTSGSTTIGYTIIISDNALNSNLTINFS